jgi:hypothetical protein
MVQTTQTLKTVPAATSTAKMEAAMATVDPKTSVPLRGRSEPFIVVCCFPLLSRHF